MKRKGIIRAAAAVVVLAMVISAVAAPLLVSYAAGPLADKINSGYDEDTWAKLQDNVLEYEEIPLLVHEYNSTVTDIWEDLEETRQKLIKNMEELQGYEWKVNRLKEDAKDRMKDAADPIEKMNSGMEYGNYAMQKAILEAVGNGLNQTAGSTMLSRSTLASLQKVENQFTQGAQSLMIAYDSLTKQKNILTKLEELYDEICQLTSHMESVGMATHDDTLQAKTNQLSARSNIAGIDSALLQLKPTLCEMTGWPADGDPELAPIPSVDLSRIDQMNLEEDTKKAIGNNSTLISQRTSEKGKTYAGIEARLDVINEGDQKLTIKMQSLYDAVLSAKTAYDAALDGYQSAQKSKDGNDRMYRLGMMSQSDYLGTEVAFYQKKAAFEMADTSLLLALETYQWAVKGLTEIE